MEILPDFPSFAERYEKGKPQVVWTTLLSDLETPVSAMLKLSDNQHNCFLLESVEGGANRGRYSFIGLTPDLIWKAHGDKAELNKDALTDPSAFKPCSAGVVDSLRSVINDSKVDLPESLPPMAAGLVGYMSYDMVRLFEKLPDDNPDVLNVPDGIFVRPTVVAVFDNIEDKINIIATVRPDKDCSAQEAYERAKNRLDEIVATLNNAPAARQHNANAPLQEIDLEKQSNMSRADFHKMVEAGKEYIFAGDIFQVVLSQRFAIPFSLPPFDLYRALRRLNPSPFLFFLDFDDFSIIGSSPEILVRVRDGKVTIRPIAGTRPRGKDKSEDENYAEDLLNDPKELAEHLMLLDLGRNDVGRVAKVGSVHVTDQNIIEYYSHVMHIVSNVEGDMDPKFDAMDALMAGFPAGTVSGAPKVRAMEIIDELEPEKRSFYAGCIGYFGADGEMDTCITLRTGLVKDGTLYVQAGGGIVADSDPEAEYQESCNKARAIIRASEEAVKLAGSSNG
ncbi:MAG: anthranilate synthase component I [Rhodospirillaceae bacterium]|jgi:anthranilate synthase component 1